MDDPTLPKKQSIKVLYSFPHRIGAGRICNTAWQQVTGILNAGCSVTLFTASVARPLAPTVKVHKTLGIGKLRVPIKLLGRDAACKWHDQRVAKWLRKNHRSIDVVHCWPMGSFETLRVARELGIPTFLERPNTHTRFAYNVSDEEDKIVGIQLPEGHDHHSNPKTLALEEKEYDLADYLLCPSDFVAKTFSDLGFPDDKLLRHQYGCDLTRFTPDPEFDVHSNPFRAIYAGVCEPRKGLHYALKAWLDSKASETGEFLICGSFVPEYEEKLKELLTHPSIKYLGHRSDLPELMRKSHVFILSSVEEGSALVTYEARSSGCVLLVSESTGAVCSADVTGKLHSPRDWETLSQHLSDSIENRGNLETLRSNSLQERETLSWNHAGVVVTELYSSKISKA